VTSLSGLWRAAPRSENRPRAPPRKSHLAIASTLRDICAMTGKSPATMESFDSFRERSL